MRPKDWQEEKNKRMNGKTKWTHFWDMHSGGGQKEEWGHIYIEAPEEEAGVIFYNRFGHSPNRITCTCCGPDYATMEYDTLADATSFHRGRGSLETALKNGYFQKYREKNKFLVIYAKDIEPSEREGTVPNQGYVWVD